MSGQTDLERAAAKRRAALESGDDRTQRDIDSLLVERQGYVVRGLDERVAAVDEQLAARGVTTRPSRREGSDG